MANLGFLENSHDIPLLTRTISHLLGFARNLGTSHEMVWIRTIRTKLSSSWGIVNNLEIRSRWNQVIFIKGLICCRGCRIRKCKIWIQVCFSFDNYNFERIKEQTMPLFEENREKSKEALIKCVNRMFNLSSTIPCT